MTLKQWLNRKWHKFAEKHWRKSHLIDCRSPQNDYHYGYADKDTLMFYGCFNLLQRYVEDERPFEIIDWDCDERAKNQAQEIKELYYWWVTGRAKEHEAVDRICDGLDITIKFKPTIHPGLSELDCKTFNQNPKWKEYCNRSDELRVKDDKMFDRLMAIRHSLWT